MLPIIKKVKLPENNFPCIWQTVIFRNYGFVSTDNIASVLKCSSDVVLSEAKRLGLDNVIYDENWIKLGYMTVIRNNWFLLPYNQLLVLLGFSQEKLDFILKNEDFFGEKLGSFKPELEEVTYTPLNKEQIAETEKIARIVACGYRDGFAKKFSFFDDSCKEKGFLQDRSGVRIVHGYLTPCGDVFSEDSEKYMPDALLQEYAQKGINGVWVHAMLSVLSPYPFDKSQSDDYKQRRVALQKLVDRCAKFGVKVYLYLNEPRGIAVEKLGDFKHLAGRIENGVASLCFEHKEVQDYLYNAVKDLFESVKGLGGCFTITMSENQTHCHFRQGNNCPICGGVSPEEVTSRINNVILKAVKDSGSNAEVIANLWGWSTYMGWTEEQLINGIDLLDKDVSVLCVSEFDLDIEKGGIKSRIIDYSIANPGPGEIAKKSLTFAREKGHKTYAKIQVNNSWECSAVPYLPVFDLTYEHLKNLTEIGVDDYLLTWTQGGYPSPTMDMIADYSSQKENFSLSSWYDKYFGEKSKEIQRAVDKICSAFREYPFSIQNLYLSPRTLGLANLWDKAPSEKSSTMVCYAYDDYKNWLGPYPLEVFISQYNKLLTKWKEGVEILEKINDNQLIDELLTYSKVAYCHFYSDLLQTEYSYKKSMQDKNGIDELLIKEKGLSLELLALLKKSPFIGFETSNHYFYTERNVVEKLINVERLQREI